MTSVLMVKWSIWYKEILGLKENCECTNWWAIIYIYIYVCVCVCIYITG